MKKLLTLLLVFSFVLVPIVPSIAAEGEVCGVDGNTYASSDEAESAEVDVSYEFACVAPASEEGLYEAKNEINFAGMLIEVGSTDIPTNLIIRDNKTGTDYTVSIDSDTTLGNRKTETTSLSDWIPGDQIRIIGEKNENTGTVEADRAVNLSIDRNGNRGANGWITNVDKDAKEITYQWANAEHTFKYDDDTRFVVGLKNPASADDLEVNDRIRARVVSSTNTAKIVIVLRRGSDLFMKIRTFRPIVTLTRMDSTVVPTTIQVKMEKTPGLSEGDVNNLIGTEGTLITINVTEDTRIVRKYFGKTTLEELSIGDKLRIVGRVNDDGTVDAKLIKDNSIWKTNLHGHAGVATEVNTDESYLMMNWTPIKRLTVKKLKEKLEAADTTVTAQMVASGTDMQINPIRAKIRARIQNFKEKIGKFKRIIKQKRVKIDRIKHNVKLSELIERKPAKKIKVEITSDTKIVVGTNENATIADIKNGDKIRVRGTRHASLPLIVADKVVVVGSLPEIEEALDQSINDINEIVTEVATDDTENAIVDDTTTDTEEEVTTEGSEGTEDGSTSDDTDDTSGDDDDTATSTDDVLDTTDDTDDDTGTSTDTTA